jgi:hypothetical protein
LLPASVSDSVPFFELEQRQGVAAFLARPMQAAGDHQVQHEEQVVLQPEDDALAQPPQGAHSFSVNHPDRRHRGAQQEWVEELDADQALAADQALQAVEIGA